MIETTTLFDLENQHTSGAYGKRPTALMRGAMAYSSTISWAIAIWTPRAAKVSPHWVTAIQPSSRRLAIKPIR